MENHAILLLLLVPLTLISCDREKKMFDRQLPGHTGIHFSNRITENDTFNILTYEYVYNGGGVGVGDFNQDGLQDLFFTANMTGNKLYLNRGDFKFEDITEAAGVSQSNRWNSGVAIVDINGDGWLDLYVCATTYNPASRRTNSLFINNGSSSLPAETVSFTEAAHLYGIDDSTHTTNAAFFDYDNDGDLDLYLLINQMDENSIPNQYRHKITDGTSRRTDKLLRNDFDEKLGHPVFTDVSIQAGITIEGFGLGLNICDINGDGWKDIYVTNDYITNDLLWINNGPENLRRAETNDSLLPFFSDKSSRYLKHTSHSAMGNDIADLNNDGLVDIVAVDMLPRNNLRRKTMLPPNNYNSYLNNDRYGYQYQYVRNTLQLNQGTRPDSQDPLFSEISMLAEISSTDWSWAPLLADYDNDGFRDLIITNGFPNDVTDRDFMDYNSENGSFVTREQLLEKIPSIKIRNYAFQNRTGYSSDFKVQSVPVFSDVSTDWGFTENSFSNGGAYADLDNDGDLDLIINNINDSAFIYKNNLREIRPESSNWFRVKFKGNQKNLQGLGAIVKIFFADSLHQIAENTPYRGYLSSVEGGVHFGLGSHSKIDSVIILWQSGEVEMVENPQINQIFIADIKNAQKKQRQYNASPAAVTPIFTQVNAEVKINYKHEETDFIDFRVQPLLLHKLSQYGPGIAVADVNGDSLDDFYVGGSRFFKGKFFIQKRDGTFELADLLPGNEGDTKVYEELGVLFFDADNDGDVDLYLACGGYEYNITDTSYQDRLFINDGYSFTWEKNKLPEFLSSGSCVKAADYDRDGDLDLFIGGRVHPLEYPRPVSSHLLQNDGQGNFKIVNETSAPDLDNIGMICDALWTDFDNDGWMDLLLAGEWMPLTFLHNKQGNLQKDPALVLDHSKGWWNSLAAADFDLDGDIDYVAGNLGLNTLLKANESHPISIYATDFDGNSPENKTPGSAFGNQNKGFDAIPSVFFPDEDGSLSEFPFFSRMDMEKQVIGVKRMYLQHSLYGQATMEEIIRQFPDTSALVLQANHLRTSLIENLGNGKFALHDLPLSAQVAPVYGMLAGDFNNDHLPDILMTGNDYGTEVGMGRYDAFNGLFLAGDGKGNFKPTSASSSGIVIDGDGKSLVRLQSADQKSLIVAGQNKGPLLTFKHADSDLRSIILEPSACTAIIHLKDGRNYREELPYGQSYLSQSARRLWLSQDVESFQILSFQGAILKEDKKAL